MMRESINAMLDDGELIGRVVDVNELLDLIRGKWGDLDNDSGCYCNRAWMSVRDFAEMIVENAYPADY